MLASTITSAVFGLNGRLVEVEVDIAAGIPKFTIVGLPDMAVQESRERVRSALANSGADFPLNRLTVSLAPADLPKSGPYYDLPIAAGILAASRQLPKLPKDALLLGELGLDGALRPINGVLPMVATGRRHGIKTLYLPSGNAAEAALVGGMQVYALKSLRQLMEHLKGEQLLKPFVPQPQTVQRDRRTPDLGAVKGQEQVKRVLEITAAGGHNLLMLGPPGTGKTMLARCLPGIMPPLTSEEALEVTTIRSVAGSIPTDTPLVTSRPFRTPHYTISPIGLVGGGAHPRPGEVTLSHRGVLFMDELPEFGRATLEVLRQPLEDKDVTITRASGTITYPANFMLVAAMNPCPCGYMGHQEQECKCTGGAVAQYKRRISGPLLDRFDIFIEVPRIEYDELSAVSAGDGSELVRARVVEARAIQTARFGDSGKFSNADIEADEIDTLCALDEAPNQLLKQAADRMKLSARAVHRLLKVARTIADLDNQERINTGHIGEATRYRAWSG